MNFFIAFWNWIYFSIHFGIKIQLVHRILFRYLVPPSSSEPRKMFVLKISEHKNVKVFISHGGLMGTQEAFYFGIPIVGIPLFGDQPTNLMKIANKNLGITLGALKNVTLETLSYALNTVLKNDSYRYVYVEKLTNWISRGFVMYRVMQKRHDMYLQINLGNESVADLSPVTEIQNAFVHNFT